jgi:NitT/TauT family transport system ATP-binding protein
VIADTELKATPSAAISVEDVTVQFQGEARRRVTALDHLTLTFAVGGITCVVGPSGQGKSTLVNVIGGFLAPTSGTVRVGDQPVRGPSKQVGVVFQRDTAFPWKRVEQIVAFGPRVQGRSRAEALQIAHAYLDRVGLSDVRRSWPRELSGGMRKRVQIAAAFAANPQILVMDEPFGAIDFVTRLKLQRLLLRLWEEEHKTVIFVTHDVDEALSLGDRVVVLAGGRVTDSVPVELPRPRTEDVQSTPEWHTLRRRLLHDLGVDDL